MSDEVVFIVAQSCLILCDPMDCSLDCSLPSSSVHGDSPGKNTGLGCHALLQGIFPTQGSIPGLLHCRRILCRLSPQGSPGGWQRCLPGEESLCICRDSSISVLSHTGVGLRAEALAPLWGSWEDRAHTWVASHGSGIPKFQVHYPCTNKSCCSK